MLEGIPFLSGLGSINAMNIVMYLFWIFLILMVVGAGFGIFIFFMIRAKSITIFEVDLISRRIKKYLARIVVDKKTKAQKLWIKKYKKFIDRPQQEDMVYLGKRDGMILIKDNNGLHHTLKMLTQEELVKFYKDIKNIDIVSEFVQQDDGKGNQVSVENEWHKFFQIYAMPNPNEDLDWLGNEISGADTEYKKEVIWWQHPSVMVIGTAFICAIMFIVTTIIIKKF